MKIIAGLGNPGQEYQATRHNVGFMVVDELARLWKIDNWRNRHEALVAEYRDAQEPVLLVKPMTYMNLSGVAVGALARWYKVAPEDIMVIYDDMDIPCGKLRLRKKGSAGGHRGLVSLLEHLGTEEFFRIRVGIGRPPAGWQVVDYVLSRFSAEEAKLVTQAVERAAQAVVCAIDRGVDLAMNRYNK